MGGGGASIFTRGVPRATTSQDYVQGEEELMASRGKFFVVTGGEGTGKTTCIGLLQEILPPDRFCFTREPGGSDFGETARGIFKKQYGVKPDEFENMLIIEAARSHHVRSVVLPMLEKGMHVVCDRFDESTWGYQCRGGGVYGEKLRQLFYELNATACHGIRPDCYIVLDVPVATAMKRIAAGRGLAYDPYDNESPETHQGIVDGIKYFVAFKSHRIVDGLKPPEAVAQEVADTIRSFTGPL